MQLCTYLLLVLSITSSLATEKRFSGDSSDKSSNNPFMWMMIKQLDRTETRVNKVHTLSNQNHIAINKIKGLLEKDEITQLKSFMREMRKKMRNMKSEIDDLRTRTCQKDWIRYMGHCYLFVYKKVTWNTAKNECQHKGGYLVKVESAAENSWLILALNAEVWIGLSDIRTEGQWRWTSDNTDTSFSYWLSHEPNGGHRENCVNICKALCGHNIYGWNDLPCNYQLGYVCEKQM
ncbi:neurocan core protein [Mytilus galloprovincialis]|uniref:Neurocan core protein n=1 Tax=Mytilus galloprovincialis TaxID=29158 RepID=A0A8B6DV72_MYTGA|nr:neurocan core protein [Mytilus galloprovincialis]